jgi:hypothetical protein
MSTEEMAHYAEADTSDAFSKGDTLRTSTVALAKRCGARFAVDQVPESELLNLMHLAFYEQDNTTVAAAAARYLALPRKAEAQRWALYAVDTAYLNAIPKRIPEAEAIAARLDSLGPTAAGVRGDIHWLLLKIAERRFGDPGAADLMARHAEGVLRAAKDMTAANEVFGEQAPSVAAAFELWRVELFKEPKGVFERTRARALAAGMPAAHWDTLMMVMHDQRWDWMAKQIGTPIKPLTGVYWAGTTDSARRQWPVPGVTSVYLRALQPENEATPRSVWYEIEAQRMGMWRRLLAKYGSAVQVTVMAVAEGSFRNGPPLSPQQEAEALAKFYQQAMGAPVTVALADVQVTELPDGRRIRQKSALVQDPFYGLQFMLADKAGKVALLSNGRVGMSEPMLDLWIGRETRR